MEHDQGEKKTNSTKHKSGGIMHPCRRRDEVRTSLIAPSALLRVHKNFPRQRTTSVVSTLQCQTVRQRK